MISIITMTIAITITCLTYGVHESWVGENLEKPCRNGKDHKICKRWGRTRPGRGMHCESVDTGRKCLEPSTPASSSLLSALSLHSSPFPAHGKTPVPEPRLGGALQEL